MHNNVPHDSERGAKKKIKGNIYLGSLDFTYNRYNWIARGNIDYGYVSNAKEISNLAYPNTQYVKSYENRKRKVFWQPRNGYDVRVWLRYLLTI